MPVEDLIRSQFQNETEFTDQVGGNHEIWHQDAFKGGELKLINSNLGKC